MKIGLVAIARHENKYLKDWIDYYRNIGISHIIIGDNNDITNDEDIQEYINTLGYQDFVTVENKKKKSSDKTPLIEQVNFYNDMYKKYSSDFDWLCFFDIDEYFEVLPGCLNSNNIND